MSVARLPFLKSNTLLTARWLPHQPLLCSHQWRRLNSTRQRPSRFSSYIPHLSNLSTRTGVPLPSLVFSFAILHELTAIIPLILAFFVFQAAGIGGTIVEWAAGISSTQVEGGGLDWRVKVGEWLEEGERRVDRIARRYGLFSRVKGEAKSAQQLEMERETPKEMGMDVVAAAKGSKAAQDVANALSAYLLVKVLLPVRLGASLALSPAFSRLLVEPTRKFIWHGVFRRPVVATKNGSSAAGKASGAVNSVGKQAGGKASD